MTISNGGLSEKRIVLGYMHPKYTKRPGDVFFIPKGKIDAAIKKVMFTAEDLGGAHVQLPVAFDNGSFAFTFTTNAHGKKGYYAVTGVSSGSSTTYFHLSDWAINKEGILEIPLPHRFHQFTSQYIPSNCKLIVWLVAQDGKKIAESTVNVER